MKRSFAEYLKRKKAEFGSKFDASDLDKRFVPYYESGERIKVDMWLSEKPISGTVGVTTGWKPAFLLMRTSRSYGSSDVLGKGDRIIGVVKKR